MEKAFRRFYRQKFSGMQQAGVKALRQLKGGFHLTLARPTT